MNVPTPTETLLEEIQVVKLTQPAIAQVIAMIILAGEHEKVDWKLVNAAIRERWSPSARSRILTMAWNIAEQAHRAQKTEVTS